MNKKQKDKISAMYKKIDQAMTDIDLSLDFLEEIMDEKVLGEYSEALANFYYRLGELDCGVREGSKLISDVAAILKRHETGDNYFHKTDKVV